MKETLKQKIAEKTPEVQNLWKSFDEKKQAADADPDNKQLFAELETVYKSYEGEAKALNDLRDQYRSRLEMETSKEPESPVDRPSPAQQESKSFGERVVSAPEYKALQESGALTSSNGPHLPRLEATTRAELKTLLTGVGAPGTTMLRNERLPNIAPLRRQNLQLVNLLTVAETDAAVVEWVRHSATTNNAAEVAEATATAGVTGTKPESAITFVLENSTVRTIAHWIPATRQALADIAQLRSIVDNELADGVNRRLNTQVLSGDGVAPNLRGILNTPGIATQALGVDSRTDAIFKALTVARIAFEEPNAIVMNPADWQDIRLTKDSQGNYQFGPAYTAGEDMLWGVRVVLDQTIPAGTALVGDFGSAVLYIREGVTVTSSDSHSDFFVRNMIVILAEGRYALAVPRPAAFVQVTGI